MSTLSVGYLQTIVYDFKHDHVNEAFEKFKSIPNDAKNKIFENVWIIKDKCGSDPQYGERAFYGNEFNCTHGQRAAAIENYIKTIENIYVKVSKSSFSNGTLLNARSLANELDTRIDVKNRYMPDDDDMLACKVYSLASETLCFSLTKMDETEYKKLRDENNEFFDTRMPKVGIGHTVGAVVTASVISVLTTGGLLFIGGPLPVAALIGAGLGSETLFSLIGATAIVKTEQDEIAKQLGAERINRLQQKITFITNTISNLSTQKDIEQLEIAKTHFEIIKKRYLERINVILKT